MIAGKMLNEEEQQKAQEYVGFYYFWLFHYCARNYEKELQNKLPPHIEKPATSGQKISPSKETKIELYHDVKIKDFVEGAEEFKQEMINNLSLSDATTAHNHMKEYIEPLASYLDRLNERDSLAEDIYFGHPLSRLAPNLAGDRGFTKVNSLFDSGAPSNFPELILQRLYEDDPLARIFSLSSNEGMELLGTSNAHISNDGHLRGNIIIKFDLNSPECVLLQFISQLKKQKFDSFPQYIDFPSSSIRYDDYASQYEIIKKTTNSSFAVKDDAARAVGLWFWDAINSIKIVDSMAKAIRLIDREPILGVTYANEEDNPPFSQVSLDHHSGTFLIPSRDVFRKLGYGASDPSVFRRLYRNTQKCIEACEVLNLKS